MAIFGETNFSTAQSQAFRSLLSLVGVCTIFDPYPAVLGVDNWIANIAIPYLGQQHKELSRNTVKVLHHHTWSSQLELSKSL